MGQKLIFYSKIAKKVIAPKKLKNYHFAQKPKDIPKNIGIQAPRNIRSSKN